MDPNWSPNSYIEDGHFGQNGKIVSLALGAPAVTMVREAASIMKEAANKRLVEEMNSQGDIMQYGNTRGDPKYRIELATFLTRQYGSYPVDKDDLICTAGATHGLHTLASLLFQPGDVAFIEDPTYFVAKKVLADCNLQIVPVPRNSMGMDIDILEKLISSYMYNDGGKRGVTEQKPFRFLVYIVTICHNPTGRCMAPESCQKLVKLAKAYDCLIISDDVYNCLSLQTNPDGSFAHPPPRLYVYDNKSDIDYKGHVISNGSFTKYMGPGLRLGWWEAPKRLHDTLRESGYMDSGGGFNHFTGGIIGTALELGLVDKHLQTIRKVHQERVRVVCKVLKEKMPGGVTFEEPQGGYFFWIQFPDTIDVLKLRKTCIDDHGVSFLPGQKCSPAGNFRNYARLSFSYYSKDVLEMAVTKLATATTKMMQQNESCEE